MTCPLPVTELLSRSLCVALHLHLQQPAAVQCCSAPAQTCELHISYTSTPLRLCVREGWCTTGPQGTHVRPGPPMYGMSRSLLSACMRLQARCIRVWGGCETLECVGAAQTSTGVPQHCVSRFNKSGGVFWVVVLITTTISPAALQQRCKTYVKFGHDATPRLRDEHVLLWRARQPVQCINQVVFGADLVPCVAAHCIAM